MKIFSDGSADLPRQLMKDWDITLVPLSVHFEHDQYNSEMDLQHFYDKMKQEKLLPKTSSPAPDDFCRMFQNTPEGKDILVISLSSALSSTYHHAVMGREMALEKDASRNIEVIDSKNASMGLGLIAYRAAILAKEGHAYQDVVDFVKKKVAECRNYFVLDNLENVIKGGRLDRVRGTIASVLNIKLLMKASDEGTLEVLEKVRGSQNAIKRMIDRLGEGVQDFEKRFLAVAHSNCEEKAREVMEQIMKRYPFKEAIVTEMGPVIGTYAGEGGILVAHV